MKFKAWLKKNEHIVWPYVAGFAILSVGITLIVGGHHLDKIESRVTWPTSLHDSGRVIKVSVEPGDIYRIVLVNSDFSIHSVPGSSVSLRIGKPHFSIVKSVPSNIFASCRGNGEQFKYVDKSSPIEMWECGGIVGASLTLPACSSYRDTQQYVVKSASSSSSSSALLGLVYSSSSSSSSNEYQYRDEDLVIPCIRD